jgi:hypothetical protein
VFATASRYLTNSYVALVKLNDLVVFFKRAGDTGRGMIVSKCIFEAHGQTISAR